MMGWGSVPPLWFGGGRIDAFAPKEDVNWGHEPEWLKDDHHHHHHHEKNEHPHNNKGKASLGPDAAHSGAVAEIKYEFENLARHI